MKMMKLLIAGLFAVAATNVFPAMLYTNEVNGVKWVYSVSDGKATLGGGNSSQRAIVGAVPENVVVPSTFGDIQVSSIASYAFSGFSGITNLVVPTSVQNIGYGAFGGCTSLKLLTIPFVGNRRGDISGTGALFGSMFGNYSSASSRETRQSYYNNGTRTQTSYIPTNLTSVVVTDETKIGDYAFQNCTMLTNIVVNDTVSNIGSYAFQNCSGLKIHPIPSSVATIGSYAFQNCTALTEINLPNSVRKLNDYAFDNCWRVAALTIQNSVTNIGQYAFQKCSGLTTLSVPNSVEYIGYNAFGGCYRLSAMTLPFIGSRRGNANGYGDNFGYVFGSSSSGDSASVRQYYYYNNGNSSSYNTYYIPTNLTSVIITDESVVRPYAFQNCTMLTNIVVNDTVSTIGNYAFSGCTAMPCFNIPASAISIGSYAFSGCASLSDVQISSSVKWIGSYAFQNCSRLFEVDLPEGVCRIYDYAFSGCSHASSLTIPNTVTNIGQYAFQNCSSLISVEVPKSVMYIGYNAFGGCHNLSSLQLPFVGLQRGNANGYGDNFGYIFGSSSGSTGCSSVRQNYYYNNGNNSSSYTYYIPTGLTSVTITDETLLRPYAFQNCTMLTNIVMNSGVTGVGSYAFSGCTGLRSFSVPDSATSIGSYAFYGCSAISELTVPANVRSIGSYAFQNCSNLTSLRILSDYVAIDQYAFSGCPASMFDTTSVAGLKLLDGYVVGAESTLSGVVDLSKTRGVIANAFYCNTKITKVVLPDGMTLIPAYAFYGCSSLASITIPDTVQSINSSAFGGCTSLTSVTIPDATTSIGDNAFSGCRNISTLKLSKNLKTIGSYAFQSCTSLLALNLSDGLQSIGHYAFAYCSSLRSMTIPATLKTIGSGAFNGDAKLATVNISDLSAWCKISFGDASSNPAYYSHSLTLNGEVIHDLMLPEEISGLLDYAFCDNYALTSVTVPDGVTAIPRSAFSRCGGVTNAVLPESVADIKMYAFQGCTNIAEFAFPPSVTNIDAYAFSECNGLASLNLPSSLQTICDYSFYKCHGISTVEIPSNVVSIGQYAFNTCTNLSSVTIHSGLTSIGNSAFYGCSRLKVVLADDVGTVPPNLFRYCGGIYDVVFAESVTNIASSAFYGCSYITNLQLPTHLNRIGDYAFYGCTSLSEVAIPEGVNSIGQYAFAGCTKLTHAVLPSTAKNIGQYAFSGCTKLSSIDLTEGTTSIGGYAFRNCTGLKSVVLPGTVKNVGDYAFEGCAGLEAVSFPDGLTTIGNYSFRNCRSLSSLEIPSSVSKVGDYAFEGCNGLTNLAIPQGVATIGSYAFHACTNLVSLSVPASATNIGWYAFAACSNLTQVTLLTTPSRVIPTTDIELKQSDWSVVDGDTIVTDSPKMTSMMKNEMTEDGVISFEWKVPGHWYHSDYSNTDYFEPTGYLSVTFDDYWYEYSWYGESCGSEDWQSVTTSLGGRSWHTLDWWYDRYYSYYYGNEINIDQNTNHGRIRSLSFIQGRFGGAGVNGTVIGASAFEGCVKLARVDIEDVGAWCGTIFENAWANPLRYARRLHVNGEELRNLVIPDTANAVAGWAFADCGTITNVVIPQGVAYIGSHAFQGLNIGEIVLPSSVTNVGSFAFAGCDGVKTLSLTSGLKKINDFAFSGQSRILSATLPSTTVLSKYVPDSLGSIRAITIAEGETEIIDNAFAGCTALESVAIPDSIARIGQYAFKGCSRLAEINIPASANVVSYNAFDDCARLREIVVDGGNASYSSRDGILFDERGNGESLARCPQAIETKDYAVPESVARISSYAFAGCVGIEKITVPASVADIGTRAFKDCGSLAEIDVAEDNLAYKSISGVLFTKDGSTLLRFPPAKAGHYDIPEGVTTIAPYAFEGCVKLTAISFCTDVNAVEAHAFDGCVLLSQAVLNAGLTRIGDYAFANCASLAAMTLPEAVTSLGEGAFDGCDQLVSLYIPENITIKPMKIGGLIRGTKSLYRGCVYNVTNDLIIAGGAQLTIPAGVTLKLTQWRSVIVRNNGRLVASGTRAAPVVFTALADDDFGGDTNGDGSSSRPQAGAWSGLNVFGEADLSYTRIRYGSTLLNVENAPSWEWYGGSSDDYWMDYEYDYNDGKSGIVNLDGCVLEHADSNGIVNYGGKVFAHNSMFTDLDTAIMGYPWGYYGDGATGTNLFVNCVVEGCDYATYSYTWYDSGYYYSDGAAAFENCILANIQGWVDDGNGVPNERIPEGIIFRNCCFWNPVDEFYPIQTNSLVGVDGNIWDNPQFENVEGGDYRIKAASPCVDAGCDGSNVPVRDYFGQPRNGTPDIGIHEVQVRPVDDADLAALSVSGDAMAEIGGTITVAWTVGNVGTVDIADEWRDVLELVDANGRAVELGRHTAINGLVSGGNLTFTASYPVPSMSPGTARLRLKVNPFRDIYEGSLTANNIYLSEATIEIVLPAYNPAVNSNFDLRAGGSVALRVPAGSGTTAFRITPSAASGSGVVAISAYALAGGVPAGLRYDVMAQPLANGVYLLVLPKDAEGTDYNIAVFNDGTTAATVKLESVSDALSVLEVAPSRLANTGEGHIAMLGVGMDRVSNVRLEGSQTISASKFRTDSSANLSATFDMSGATVGNYAVVLVDEDGTTHRTGQTVEIYNPKIGPKLEAWLELPSSTRQGRVYTGRICYRNSGDEDMPAPFIRLLSEDALIREENECEFCSKSIEIIGVSDHSPYSILIPGEIYHYEFEFKSGAATTFYLRTENDTTMEWSNLRTNLSHAVEILNNRGRMVHDFSEIFDYAENSRTGSVFRTVCGKVLSYDGVPLSKVIVGILAFDGTIYGVGITRSDGYFEITIPSDCESCIMRSFDGALWDDVELTVPLDSDVTGITMVSKQAYDISCVPIFPDNMETFFPETKLCACAVNLETGESFCSRMGEDSCDIDLRVYGDGFYRVDLTLLGQNVGSEVIELTSANIKNEFKIQCDIERMITGQVKSEDGHFMAGIPVYLMTLDVDSYLVSIATTRDDGSFFFANIPQGDYVFSTDPAIGFFTNSTNINVHSGGCVADISLSLSLNECEISGMAIGAPDGRLVIAMSVDCDEVYAARIEGEKFSMNLPSGTYNFVAISKDFVPLSQVEVVTVSNEGCEIVLQVEKTNLLCGHIEDTKGHPISNAKIVIKSESELLACIMTGKEGEYSLGLIDGEYQITISAPGYNSRNENFVFHEGKTFDAVLAEGNCICGTLPDDSYSTLVFLYSNDEIIDILDVDEHRSFASSALKSGEYVLKRHDDGGVFMASVTVAEESPCVVDWVSVDKSAFGIDYANARYVSKGSLHSTQVSKGSVTYGDLRNTSDAPQQIWYLGMSEREEHYNRVYRDASQYLDREPPTYKCKHNLKTYEDYIEARDAYLHAAQMAQWTLESLHHTKVGLRLNGVSETLEHLPGFSTGYAIVALNDVLKDAECKSLFDRIMKLVKDIMQISDAISDLYKEIRFIVQSVTMNNQLARLGSLEDLDIAFELLEAAKKVPGANLSMLDARIVAVEQKIGKIKELQNSLKCMKDELNSIRDHFRWEGGKFAKLMKVLGLIMDLVNALDFRTEMLKMQDAYGELMDYELAYDLNEGKALDAALSRLIAAYNKPYHYDCGEGHFALTVQVDVELLYTPVSCDPNEMSGPMGVGDSETERFLKPGEEATYTIYFENKSDAGTAAQEIRVTETLDPALDWSTFRLGEVAFNNQIDNNLSGCSSGMSEVKMNGTNYYVRTEVSFDATTGKVTWYLRIVDKTTPDEWPTDLHAGILPPNDSTFRGEGHLTYRVNVRKDAAPGTRINASASIVFDYNAAIETDPAWWNTVAQVAGVTVYDEVEDGKTDLDLIVGQPYGELPTPKPREGYTFVGWWTALGGPNGTGRQVTPESIVEADDSGLFSYWLLDTTPTSVIEVLPVDATAADVNEAIDSYGFIDPNVKLIINGDVQMFNDFAIWSQSVIGGRDAVVASEYAAVSYLLRAGKVFANEPTIEIPEIAAPGQDGALTIEVSVKDGEETVVVSSEKVSEMFEATDNLKDWIGGWLKPIVVDLTEDKSSLMRFNVTLGESRPLSAFIMLKLKAKIATISPPGNTEASASEVGRVSISWDAVDGASGYEVWRATGEPITANAKLIAVVDDGTLYDDINIDVGNMYYYWLRTITSLGYSDFGDYLQVYVAPMTYIVTYKPGLYGSGATCTATKTNDVDLALRNEIYSRIGYTQTGWSTTDGGSKAYNLGASYTANAAITLYPYWTEVPGVCEICFDANGGTGTMPAQSVVIGTETNLLLNVFSRQGFTFAGWATNSSGDVAYANGASVANLAEAGESVTLYAVWLAAPSSVSASDATSTGEVTVTWPSVAHATCYQVWRGTTSSNSSATQIGYNITATSYSDTTALVGTNYYYWVKAVCGSVVSSFSGSDVGRRMIAAPSGVTVATDSTGTNLVVSWSGAVSGAAKYEIWRATYTQTSGGSVTTSASLSRIATVDAIVPASGGGTSSSGLPVKYTPAHPRTSYTDHPNLSGNKFYRYQVKAVGGSNTSAASNYSEIRTYKNAGTYSLSLPLTANYSIAAVGGGGGGAQCAHSSLIGFNTAGGGSGAYYKGVLNLAKGSYSVVVGGAGAASVKNYSFSASGNSGGTTMLKKPSTGSTLQDLLDGLNGKNSYISAGGGGGGSVSGTSATGGSGGTVSIGSSTTVVSTSSNVSGKVGDAQRQVASGSANGGASVYGGYGVGGNNVSDGGVGFFQIVINE